MYAASPFFCPLTGLLKALDLKTKLSVPGVTGLVCRRESACRSPRFFECPPLGLILIRRKILSVFVEKNSAMC